MEIDKFADIQCSRFNDKILRIDFIVKHSVPTTLQWTFAMEETKNLMEQLKKVDTPFFFVFDVREVGLLSLDCIKEFTQTMVQNAKLLEERLYASAAIAQGNIIKHIFDIINLLYKTKKPLSVVSNIDEALKFVQIHIDKDLQVENSN
uniref:STAS domain-containing protein n=1 Tax=viral metagenome TaxID=1070528 RepID=A0A6C0JIU0_9ZZZZ